MWEPRSVQPSSDRLAASLILGVAGLVALILAPFLRLFSR